MKLKAEQKIKKAENDFKKKEMDRKVELLKERQKYFIPHYLRLTIEETVNDYLNFNNKQIKKYQVESLLRRISSLKSKLNKKAYQNGINEEKYPFWKLLIEIEVDLGSLRLEINKSFFGSHRFEFNEDWIKELQSLTFE